MRVLFVAPSEYSTGEAVTALHVGRELAAAGHEIHALTSPLTASYLEAVPGAEVTFLDPDGPSNRSIWQRAIGRSRPEVVIFADYSTCFFSEGVCQLDPDFGERLDRLDAHLVTFDHLGFIDQTSLVFGPPDHRADQPLVQPPARTKVWLPCPVREPTMSAGRGVPFRYWDPATIRMRASRSEVRKRYLDDESGLLIAHSVPGWARSWVQGLRSPVYRFLPRILARYLGRLPAPVTLVSVNGGDMLGPSGDPHLRVINIESLPPDEYEELLLASDLMLTENGVSVSLGKAACGFVPCAVLMNSFTLPELLPRLDPDLRRLVDEMETVRPGAVHPHFVFPIFDPKAIDQLGLYRTSPSFADTFSALELYGGDATRDALERLLSDPSTIDEQRRHQAAYVERLNLAVTATQLLDSL